LVYLSANNIETIARPRWQALHAENVTEFKSMNWQSQTLHSPTGAALNLWVDQSAACPIGVVQINHGLAEHAARYHRFAAVLSANGFHVFAHDHRGHGATKASDAPPRLFAPKGGAAKVIADVHAVHGHIKAIHPNVPIITFGHSMGGLIALNHAMTHPSSAAGLAVWNANFSAGFLGRIGQAVLAFERFRLGHDVPSRVLPKLTFQMWAKSVKDARTGFDWLSRDPAEVDAYIQDPLCGWNASVAMWQDIFELVFNGANNTQLGKLPRALPIHIRGSGRDPATDFSKATRNLSERLKKLQFSDVALAIDDEGRHECLNDTNRDQVTADFMGWAKRVCATAQPSKA
jgi:alpha-beta hydrolase superfamily lysophospholipase